MVPWPPALPPADPTCVDTDAGERVLTGRNRLPIFELPCPAAGTTPLAPLRKCKKFNYLGELGEDLPSWGAKQISVARSVCSQPAGLSCLACRAGRGRRLQQQLLALPGGGTAPAVSTCA